MKCQSQAKTPSRAAAGIDADPETLPEPRPTGGGGVQGAYSGPKDRADRYVTRRPRQDAPDGNPAPQA